MRQAKSFGVWSIVAVCALFSTGCTIDAFGRGLADGIINGLTSVVETAITDAFAGTAGGGK